MKKTLSESNILIIDDSRTSIVLIKQQLIALGAKREQVFSSTDCKQAINMIESSFFDLLIVDYHLEQTLTGFELTSILINNKLINHKVGILIISSDTKQGTVLTALSGSARHFISKPIQTKSLGEKLELILTESEKIALLYELTPINNFDKISCAIEVVEKGGASATIESVLIDIVISSESWDLLQHFIDTSTLRNHPSKAVAQAHCLYQTGQNQAAINLLHDYLIESPLSLKVIDCLSELYREEGELKQALKYALKSFELTPSISNRAISAVNMAESLGQRETLIKIGYTYACHISLADKNWMNSVSHYLLSLEGCYKSSPEQQIRSTILQHLNNFYRLASRRLTPLRVLHLKAMLSLFQCHILIQEGKDAQAHNKLLLGLSLFYEHDYNFPSIIIKHYLPALLYFGETKIAHTFSILLKKTSSSNNSLEDLPRLFSYTTVIPQPSSLESLKMYIGKYPYSVGAKLDYIYSLSQNGQRPVVLENHLSDLSSLALPPNWMQWVQYARVEGVYLPPPEPFSI